MKVGEYAKQSDVSELQPIIGMLTWAGRDAGVAVDSVSVSQRRRSHRPQTVSRKHFEEAFRVAVDVRVVDGEEP